MFILAIDIGGSKLSTGIVRTDGTVVCRKLRAWGSLEGASVIEAVIDASKSILESCDIKPLCAGVNIPGLADKERGLWVEACFSGIKDVPIAGILSKQLGMSVYVDNDVNNCALAEKLFGVCRGCSDFIWLTVSNGCGGAVYLDGRIYRGVNGTAGEIGHICVEEEGGYECGCGNFGCLEAQAAGPGIVRRYQSGGGRSCDAKEIAELARGGDSLAQSVFKKEGYYIGKALAAVINTLSPEKAVVGGGVAGAYDLFYSELFETVCKMTYRRASRHISIEKTGLGYDAALIGAATLALKDSGRAQL